MTNFRRLLDIPSITPITIGYFSMTSTVIEDSRDMVEGRLRTKKKNEGSVGKRVKEFVKRDTGH